MRFRARTAVLFFCLVSLTSVSGALATDGEWSEAVDAAQTVDPTLTAPLVVDTDVSAVGGGDITAGPTTGQFAFSGSRKSGVATGRMTLVGAGGAIFSANVVCIQAASLPDGTSFARLVGEVVDPTVSAQSMIFNVSDSSQPGGRQDTFSGSLSGTPAAEFPCAPTTGAQPTIGNGNISIRFR